ncbi:MAG: hypothetical protein E7273_12465 [Pseudobutyrivibrio ruminis]|nr:hypothetical protein [Pseudobutyrivibrio ruminis]
MTVIIKTKKQYEDALATLEDYKKARKKILNGGQSYTIGSTQMNRASLASIEEAISAYESAIDAYESTGSTKRRVVRAVPLG